MNAVAGANRQRNRQSAAEVEQAESSTSTSDESSDDEMDTEPAESVLTQSTVSDVVGDAVCDTMTDTASVDIGNVSVDLSAASQQQDSMEHSAVQHTEPTTVRQTAVHIAVNRTAEIQVS